MPTRLDRSALKLLADGRSDDEIASLVRSALGGVDDLLARTFAGMALSFARPGPRKSATIRYEVTTDDGSRFYRLVVNRETCELVPGEGDGARVTFTLGLADWVRLAGGSLDVMSAMKSGRLRVAGDLLFALRIGRWFGAG